MDAPAATEPRLLGDRAYEGLRDRIVTLRIRPGAPIDEDAIGRELGMGRTPVREAIKRLALERLVTVYPRRGTFASDINITDLAQISDVRVVLEAHAARRAADRAASAHRPALSDLRRDLAAADPALDGVRLMELDARVHRLVYRAAENPYLAESCERYLNLSLRIWHLALDRVSSLREHVEEHAALLDAIAAGDAERAAQTMAAHVSGFAESIRAIL